MNSKFLFCFILVIKLGAISTTQLPSEPVGHDPFDVEKPFYRGQISNILHVRCLHYDS